VQLAGKILIAGGGLWSTSGTGTFSPSASQQNALYIPSAQDISSGSVTLTLLATGAGPCNISTDEVVIKFIPPPTVDAGSTIFVLHGKTATLNPTVSDSNVQYLWTPDKDIDNTTIKNPTITADVDITYTLTVTDSRGCVSSSQVSVKVSPEVIIPNTFTPNNDGINDLWNIQGLIAYQKATVDVFDRYGQKVFHSLGYPKAWDGTYGGKIVPTGTYYYIIDTKFNNQVLSGSLTLIR
jgi:large repetitive protein